MPPNAKGCGDAIIGGNMDKTATKEEKLIEKRQREINF